MRSQGRTQRARPQRVWRLSPDGFRALRHSCFLSREACAKYLGVSLRTVRLETLRRVRAIDACPYAITSFAACGHIGT